MQDAIHVGMLLINLTTFDSVWLFNFSRATCTRQAASHKGYIWLRSGEQAGQARTVIFCFKKACSHSAGMCTRSRTKSTHIRTIVCMDIKETFSPITMTSQNMTLLHLYLGAELTIYVLACFPRLLRTVSVIWFYNYKNHGFVWRFCQFPIGDVWCWRHQFTRPILCCLLLITWELVRVFCCIVLEHEELYHFNSNPLWLPRWRCGW